MPKRKAPKNTYWRGDTLYGRLMLDGREIKWSLQTDDVEAAKRRVKERKNREVAVKHGENRMRWEEAALAWEAHILASVKGSTVDRYKVSLGQMSAQLEGRYLDEVDKALVSEIIRRRRATGATNATIRRDLTALSSVLGYAEDEDWREDNPALLRLKRLKEKRDAVVLPELDHVRRVIRRAPGNFAFLIEAALLTGCRQDELVTLERRQIDHSRRQLTLYRTKSSRPRALELTPEAYHLLTSVPANLGTRFVFWHGTKAGPYMNVSSRFRVFVRSSQNSAQAERQEFRPFRFHDLRHRFAVDYLKNRVGTLYDLQKHLGHSSVRVTEIYLDYLTPEEQLFAKHGSSQISDQVQRLAPQESE